MRYNNLVSTWSTALHKHPAHSCKMPRINLLYIITKLELGGAQIQLLSLINSLNRDKFKVFLFTAKDGILVKDASVINGLTLVKSGSLERAINPLRDFSALLQIFLFIKKNKIHVVHTHSSKAGLLGRTAAKMAGVKVILHTIHGWSFNNYQHPAVRNLFIFLERMAAKFTNKIIVVCKHDLQKGLNNRIAGETKYALISYGVDYKRFNNDMGQRVKQNLGVKKEELLVTNISCFKPQKSPLDFIKLAALIKPVCPKAKFLLVGDGKLRKKIEKTVKQLNLEDRVILSGWRRDIPEILSATDIFVLTSLWEGLPITVLEAGIAGVPVVATDTGGIREVVSEGETGFMVLPRDIQGMRNKLDILLKDAFLRRKIAERSRVILGNKFCLDNSLSKISALYEGLLRKGEKK